MLDKKKKEKIIAKFKTHASDTGSAQVQIAILTEEIKDLTKHLKTHKKDFSSRRGLLKKVAERRRLLLYLKREDAKAFDKLVKELKLKVAFIEEPKKILEAVVEGLDDVEVPEEPGLEPEAEPKL